MEAAAVVSSGSVLRCSLNPVSKKQRGSARGGGGGHRNHTAALRSRLQAVAAPYGVYEWAAAVRDSDAGEWGHRGQEEEAGGVRVRRGLELPVDPRGRYGWKGERDVVALVTDKPGCGGAEHARCNGILVVVFLKSKSALEGVSTAELLNALRDLKVDPILLAGYLKLIPVELVQAYPRSVLNTHPSLLPAFGGEGYYGLKVHKAIIASGARYSGPTVHFVYEQYDTGRTLAQKVVHVLANDTPKQLATKVLHEVTSYVSSIACRTPTSIPNP